MAASSSDSPKGRRFRLLVWLSKAEEDIVTLEDIEMTRFVFSRKRLSGWGASALNFCDLFAGIPI